MNIYREIKVNYGMRKQMMEIFSTTYPSLRAALSFQVSTQKAVRMRDYALAHGGVLLETTNMAEQQ